MKDFLKVILYKPLYNILVILAWLIPGHSAGWAVIILTVLVRLALLPSSMKATRAQKKMRDLAPEIAKIKEQYKNDRQGEATATMALYKKYGVSPWGSCLPLLIQLPILIVLYRVFMNGLGQERPDLIYGFMPQVSISSHWLGADLAQMGNQLIWLPILAGLAQLVQSWQMKQLNPTPAKKDKDGKTDPGDFSQMLTGQMMFIMPIFTVIIGMRLPGFLSLYWVITTVFTIIQTAVVMKKKDRPVAATTGVVSQDPPVGDVLEKGTENGAGDIEKKISRFQKRKGRKDVTVEIRRKT